ncbi:MAG: 16S rRNA (guanine(527)-N(7))-methyltransferase RsmG [Treponema sp.]|nr:16S rRNA (guanine(527)-N(7))-methyltransferase RsmG [Treponema sp.]
MTEKLVLGLEKLGLDFSRQQVDQLEAYMAQVLEFNKGYNLMKAENADELAVNHVLDSLVAVPHLKELIEDLCEKNGKPVLEMADIGSGGGCPGIPLAIAFPNHNFTLVERMEKRCVFLNDVVKKLDLQNVKVECKAADLIKPDSFDLEVFRAFHPFDLKITKLLLRMVKKGGYIAAFKAREEKILAEMEEVKSLVKDYKKIKMTVPFLEDHHRNLVVIKK